MSIENEYNKNVDIERLVPSDDSGDDTEEYQAHLSDIRCHIQSFDESFTEDLDGNFGKDWMMWCGLEDILEGDKVIDGSDEYKVVGVRRFQFDDSDDHMELRIRKFNG